MDREVFLESIRQQYAEDIQEAFLLCEHYGGKYIDFDKLGGLLRKLMQNAQVDGLPKDEFVDLVASTLPQIEGKFEWQQEEGKKAA